MRGVRVGILVSGRQHGRVGRQGGGDARRRRGQAASGATATAGVRQSGGGGGAGEEVGVVGDGRNVAGGGHGVIGRHEAVGGGGVAVGAGVRVAQRRGRVERIRRRRGVEVHPGVLLLPFRASILEPDFHLKAQM